MPPLRQNQFGGALGGPLVRDRSVLLWQLRGAAHAPVVDAHLHCAVGGAATGDFSGVASICDPLTVDAITGTCTPFGGGRIPDDRLDPMAVALLAACAACRRQPSHCQNLTSIEKLVRDVDQVSLRIDQRVGESDQLFARFSTFDADEVQPFGTSALQETLPAGIRSRPPGRRRGISAPAIRTSSVPLVAARDTLWLDADLEAGRRARTAASISPAR